VELYTIGHSSLDVSQFIKALQRYGITRVVDVRSVPYSRYVPWTNKGQLTVELQRAGLAYEFAGRELGGRPADPSLLTATGAPDYDRIAASIPYQRGIERVLEIAGDERIALLCSEADPMRCHRERLIGRTLRARGCVVRHILRDGSLGQIRESLLGEAPAPWGSPGVQTPRVAVTLYTLGYTKKPLRRCIELLTDAGVQIVLDVRLRNTGQLAGWTKRDDLAFVLQTFGIAYSHRIDAAPTRDLLDRYRRCRDWTQYESDFRALMRERKLVPQLHDSLAGYDRICLLCSEHDPAHCHRRLLVEELGAAWQESSVVHLM